MKRLKYRCLFGGKTYPSVVATFICIACITGGVGFAPLFVLTPFIVIGALIFMIWYEHSLSDSERRMCERLSYPLWEPVTIDVRQLVITQQNSTQLGLAAILGISAMIGLLVFACAVAPGRRSKGADPAVGLGLAAVAAAGTFIFLYIRKGIGAKWMEMDDTAVYTKVPIDHMYDVTHHGKHGRTWVESYLVFYLPDGKYILPAKKGTGECNTVILVRYGKAITWFTTYELHPEDFER